MARPKPLKGKFKGGGKFRFEPYGKGKGKNDKGKGKFKGGKGKGSTPQNWAKSFADGSGTQKYVDVILPLRPLNYSIIGG